MGQWLTFVVCAGSGIYALVTWEQPHRAVLLVMLTVALASGAAISLLPTERIVRSPRREAFFLTWSALDMVLVAAVATADGGPRSPFVLLFVLPTIFAALSYPLWSTIATGAMAIAGFAVVAATSNDASLSYDLFIAFTLLCAGALSSWQARSAGRARDTLAETVAALGQSDKRTRLILETAYDAYVAIDGANAIIDWNERAEALFGWAAQEVLVR